MAGPRPEARADHRSQTDPGPGRVRPLTPAASRRQRPPVLHYGEEGALTGPDKEHAETSLLALHLLQSALVHVNTLLLQQVLAEPAGTWRHTDEGRRRLTALFWSNINLVRDLPPRHGQAARPGAHGHTPRSPPRPPHPASSNSTTAPCPRPASSVRSGALSRWPTGWDDRRVDHVGGGVRGGRVAVVPGAPVPGGGHLPLRGAVLPPPAVVP
ncbi:Tn3 family transposase [Streptomyces sp. NPDC001812]|uniref:Tn3 family transposase n=1 Tax=Streptomyces sp. NPDC001812 TaxID=3364611 RepID=UPI003694607F